MENSREAAFSLRPAADRRWAAVRAYRSAFHAASLESAEWKKARRRAGAAAHTPAGSLRQAWL